MSLVWASAARRNRALGCSGGAAGKALLPQRRGWARARLIRSSRSAAMSSASAAAGGANGAASDDPGVMAALHTSQIGKVAVGELRARPGSERLLQRDGSPLICSAADCCSRCRIRDCGLEVHSARPSHAAESSTPLSRSATRMPGGRRSLYTGCAPGLSTVPAGRARGGHHAHGRDDQGGEALSVRSARSGWPWPASWRESCNRPWPRWPHPVRRSGRS